MNFSQQPPSKQWAALKYRGVKFAEVWFKPEGEPFGLTFRIPQQSFAIAGMAAQLTLENLLKAVGIAPDEVELWRHGDVSHAGMNGSSSELKNAFSPPPQDAPYLDVHVRLHAPSPSISLAPQGKEGEVAPLPDISLLTWQDLEARWKAILAVEISLDISRKNLESLMVEVEGSLKKSLTPEEKIHALRADISNWERAKTRVHHVIPKLKEAIHRAVWALGAPERKKLEEVYKDHIQPHIPFPGAEGLLLQLENLLKDRQVLAAHAQNVYQEGRGVSTEVQGALKSLQNNAATNAQRKKAEGSGKGGKFFKTVRKASGA